MRLELSKRVDLALQAIQVLDTRGLMDGRSLARSIGTTPTYLPQVLRPLVAEGWIDSTPGPGGGYRLATDTDRLSVLDVIHAVDGPTETGRCALRGAPCPAQEQCAIHDSWVRARSALLAELDATSLTKAMASSPMKGD